MSVLVVDAGVLAVALADDGSDGDRARQRLRGESLTAPDLVDLEVTSVLRGRLAGGHLDARRALLALEDLQALPLQRVPALQLIARCWESRDNLTVYDAAYEALAEAINDRPTRCRSPEVRFSRSVGCEGVFATMQQPVAWRWPGVAG